MVRSGWGSAPIELPARHAACSARSTGRLTARGAPGSRSAAETTKRGYRGESYVISTALVFTKRENFYTVADRIGEFVR